MAYGKDPDLFADAVMYWHLLESRAENCHYEYLRFQYAFETVIAPYVDRTLVAQLNPKRLFATLLASPEK